MDVHFWIGKFSTQDEYGTAAYKTVELDNYHQDIPVQHREIQDYESEKFKSYFQHLTYLEGGCDTGFRNVGLDNYQPKLLWISTGKTKNKTEVRELACVKGSLNDEDSFILDKGAEILLYHGPKANLHEKNQSNQYSRELENSRKGKAKVVVVDELASLIPDGEMKVKQIAQYTKADDKIYKLSDASGKMELTLVDSVDLTRSILTSDDIFYIDNGAELKIWCGKNASVDERRESMITATKYLNTTNHPFAPIEVVKQGNESKEFWSLFTD
jgi:gelsolin